MAAPIYNTTKIEIVTAIEGYIKAYEEYTLRNETYTVTAADAITEQAALITGEVSFLVIKHDSSSNRIAQQINTNSLEPLLNQMNQYAPIIVAYFALYTPLNAIDYPSTENIKYKITVASENVVITPI